MEFAATLPSLLLCILHLTAGTSAEPRYVVLFPSMLYYSHPGKVHIHLMDLEEPVRVTLHLESSHGIPNVTLEAQGNDILQLNWPHFNISTPPTEIDEVAHLHVSIQGGSLQVFEQKKVLVKSLELGILVQTDKEVYKPGQTVKFRIVCLDQNFIPSNRELPLVAVQDPSGNHVVQWQKVSPRQGIVDLSFPLAADLTLGMYEIKVMGKKHFFRVDNYRLPRFEVLIQLPHVGTVKDVIPLDICGRYPSGKPFRGRAEAMLCHEDISLEGSVGICVEFSGQTGRNGCFSTKVPAASFNLTGLYVAQLCARALLLEEGTHEHSRADNHPVMSWGGGNSKKWQKAKQICTFVYVTARIIIKTTEKFYKPGIPCTGTVMLRGTNSSALEGKEFLLVVNTGGVTQRKTLLMDGSGRASFELDTSGWTDEVSLHGELKDDPPASEHEGKKYLNYQSVGHYIYPISSNSKSFLKIRRVEKKQPCGQPQKVWVDYLFDEKTMGIELQSVDVVFLVLAKGTITTVLRKELPAAAGLRGSFSLELPIGPELMPMAKVVGYVVLPNGEMVPDSIKLNLADCFPNKVNLSFSEQRALVGSQLRLKVQAAPGSLCALYAMDQGKQSSGLKDKLNPSTVFNTFPMFYEDRYPFENPDPPYCGLKDNVAAAPAINCFDVPGDSWKDCFRYRRLWRREVPLSVLQTGFDSMLMNTDLKVVTNTQLGCTSSSQFQSSFYVQGAGLEEDEQAVVIQDTEMLMDFLGTWLWELVPVGEGGSSEMTVTVPDAITEWKAGMFCTSPLGLGMAPDTTLTAFKPFFVELALPNAVVRHEAFTLVATVSNYLRQCLRVQVTLVESEKLQVLADTDKEVYRSCVCADEERTFQWNMQATRLGKVNVTVIARALHTKKPCGTEVPVVPVHGRVDTETKLLRVQSPKQM